MSSEALSWAKRTSFGGPVPKAVMLVLADYADEDGSCFPGQARVAGETETSERTVRRVLAELETVGALHREPRYRTDGHGGRTSDRIFLHLEWAPGQQVLPDMPQPAEAPPALSLISVETAQDPFDEFWAAYPRKAAKASARKAWAKAIKSAHPELIIQAARTYAADRNRVDAFTAYPATWLNGERWLDGPLPHRPSRGNQSDMSRLEMLGELHSELDDGEEAG